MKRAMLTGAGGFLGRNLLPALLDASFMVCAVSSHRLNELSRLCGRDLDACGVQVVASDDREGITRAMQGSIVVSCGFPRGGDGLAMARGLDFIAWLFRAAAENGAAAVVNVSSQSVYDQHRSHPAKESDPPCPVGDYAVAKYATELMLESSCAGVPHTSVRLASLIGPGFDQRAVNKMVNAYCDAGGGLFHESGNRFGFMDVHDAAQGLVALCIGCTRRELASAYNLGAEGSYTISEMAQAVRAAMATRGWEPCFGPIVESRDQAGLLQDTAVDASLFVEHFGWRARFALRDSVGAIADERVSRGSAGGDAAAGDSDGRDGMARP